MPEWLEVAFRIVHVLAAAVWIGGTIVLVFVAVPYARTLSGELRAQSLAALGRGWRPLGWGAFGVLLGTGLPLARNDWHHASFAVVFGAKLALVATLAVTAYLHDFVLGPRLARRIRAGEPEQPARRRLVIVGWTSFALTLIVPALGVVLVELGS